MRVNKLRQLLNNGEPTVGTRIYNSWPFITELIGASGKYNYVEFLAEYAPYDVRDFENICTAAELWGMGSIIKLDFQNRAYVAQKALASGFEGVMWTDHMTAAEVEESLFFIHPDTPEDAGRFGRPTRRFALAGPGYMTMPDYVKSQHDIVNFFMIEKKEALDNIDEICSVKGVDVVQFGPSDFSMSMGWDPRVNQDDIKAAERRMIEAALKHGVRPRCEIQSAEAAKYYIDLGVKDFSLGDELGNNIKWWNSEGGIIHEILGK